VGQNLRKQQQQIVTDILKTVSPTHSAIGLYLQHCG